MADETKAPDHAWRHRLEDCLRAAEVPEDARDAITGTRKKDHRAVLRAARGKP